MQPVCRILFVLALAWPTLLHAGDVKVKVSIRMHGWFWPFEPRYAPQPSPQHLGLTPKPATDACTFVAGVRHCPLPKPPGG
jgi:hypothetical protein